MSWLLTVMCIVIIPAAAILLSHLAVIRNFADTAEWVSSHLPAVIFEYAAVMTAVPPPTHLTVPFSSTVATFTSELVHDNLNQFLFYFFLFHIISFY